MVERFVWIEFVVVVCGWLVVVTIECGCCFFEYCLSLMLFPSFLFYPALEVFVVCCSFPVSDANFVLFLLVALWSLREITIF